MYVFFVTRGMILKRIVPLTSAYLYFIVLFFHHVQHCLLKSCQELKQKYPEAKSGIHTIDPLQKARPIEVFCEFDIEGGGFSFLPHSVTNRSDGKAIVDALFKDRKNVLLKLKKNVDDSQWYTLIQPHPNYADIDFGVLVNNYSGYTKPKNVFMQKYVFLGILPKSIANKNTTQGFRSNGIMLEFWNCDANPNSFFALFPNHHHQLPSNYAENSGFENEGIAVNWRSHAKAVSSGSLKMPNKFFFLTELHFGGCGCYTSSNRWKKFGYNATAIGIR